MPRKNSPHIVVIGGGTGSFAVLNSLKNHPVRLTAIVSMADDGGSTGVLRDQYGVLPPGDVRRALVALAQSSDTLRDLFTYRFGKGDLHGHSFGNLFLSAIEKITGSFVAAVEGAAKVLNIKGRVIPVTLHRTRLFARLCDGTVIQGERNIDIPKTKTRAPIERVWLRPAVSMNPSAKRAIADADLIVIGPGDMYTSLIPNLLVRGMPEAIRKSRAKKVYLANLMTKFGETHNFHAEDFVREIEKYLGNGVLDFVIFNKRKPRLGVLRRYKKENAEFVYPPHPTSRRKKPHVLFADLLDRGKFVRHTQGRRLAKAILSLL